MNPLKSLIRTFASAGLAVLVSGCMSLMPAMAPTVQAERNISPAFPFEPKYAQVAGSRMHYVEVGTGTPVVFVHGNPTSSYLWRNVLPIVSTEHDAIAVDLIGMGKSDKPDIAYHLEDHIRYFDGFMDAVNPTGVILVVHDWGGPIGLDWAMRHPERVKGIVMMETLVRPMHWRETGFAMSYMFKKFRDPEEGDALIIRQNYFVEKLIPMMSGRKLSEAEMDAYRAPYLKETDRKLIATWPREIPIDGVPERNELRIERNYELLQHSTIPLLLLRATPGAIMSEEHVASLKAALPRLEIRNIGPGIHYVQEAQPTNIGSAINEWARGLH